MMNILIIAPSDKPTAATLRENLLNTGLRPENIIVKTDQFLADDVPRTVNKMSINRILTVGVPSGSLDGLLKKFLKGPVHPKVFCFKKDEEPQSLKLKNGVLHVVNCVSQLFK